MIALLAQIVVLTVAMALPPQQPVIGIFTLEEEDKGVPENTTYIAASYVKNLEMAGAQVIPLHMHYSENKLKEIMGKINGVFFTGGNENLDFDNEWTMKVAFIIEYAKEQNRQGNPYPIWATCLGFQAVMYVTSGLESNATVFSDIEDQDEVVRPLKVLYRDNQLLNSLNTQEYEDATG